MRTIKRVIVVLTPVFFIYLFFRVDKKRDKMERQILDSQERAFWNVHRPPVRIKDCNHSQ